MKPRGINYYFDFFSVGGAWPLHAHGRTRARRCASERCDAYAHIAVRAVERLHAR